jgi:hypothetical protein
MSRLAETLRMHTTKKIKQNPANAIKESRQQDTAAIHRSSGFNSS